jgi:hypothetical protein
MSQLLKRQFVRQTQEPDKSEKYQAIKMAAKHADFSSSEEGVSPTSEM